mmetsp:Transcript_8860/g.13115  ORF Transcript_8860/g.13115 Transcript_8860/m.13115 type:complete len:733 (-) Transcript_8860:194-2392(-)
MKFSNVAIVAACLPSAAYGFAGMTMKAASDILWTPSIKSGARDEQFGPITQYCPSLNQAIRRKSRTVTCGPIKFGSEHPIVKQTMGTTDTSDVDATIEQVMRCADKGFDLVRITVQGRREANACMKIREGLFKKGYDIPLCADMHFQPKVAMMVAEALEKIRINPGNFADGTKDFDEHVYDTEDDFTQEREYLTEAFTPLVEKCRDLNRAMRIGTNHGSLSSRVLSFYGDTPRGMVESAIEFADIARASDYHNFVFSMKASNPLVMVQAYRLLAAEQYRLGWDYPLHLGVTEAGEGEDGRMKSAIGIGTLLADGLGDTVRVSLTEDPEFEYEPCNRLISISGETLYSSSDEQKTKQDAVEPYIDTRDFQSYSRRRGNVEGLGEVDPEQPRLSGTWLNPDGSVVTPVSGEMFTKENAQYLYSALGFKVSLGMPFRDIASVDSILLTSLPTDDDWVYVKRLQELGVGIIIPKELNAGQEGVISMTTLKDAIADSGLPSGAVRNTVIIDGTETLDELEQLEKINPAFVFLKVDDSVSTLHGGRRVFEHLKATENLVPVIHYYTTKTDDKNELALQMGSQLGSLLADGNGDGVMIQDVNGSFELDYLRTTSFSLLQGCRMRSTKTEFVSCPSCGRTLFDLQETTAKITEATGHLPGVTVAVMGCIVNGPGEMADADFGYVGTIPGKVDLYYGKEVIKKSIPNDEAVGELINLIKEYGMWKDKEEEESETAEELVAA